MSALVSFMGLLANASFQPPAISNVEVIGPLLQVKGGVLQLSVFFRPDQSDIAEQLQAMGFPITLNCFQTPIR